MEGSKNYFHSLDALRFFAFLKVFIFHIPLIFVAENEPFKQWFSDHIRHGGGIGVSFFFVLSGFLITNILAKEKLRTGTIDLKRFFVRRAFRIWPLYYFLVIVALTLPYDWAQSAGFHTNWGGYDPDWRFSLAFADNYKSLIMDLPPKTTPLPVFWSLCIEVHFYLLWMVVLYFIKGKWIPYFLITAIVLAWIFRIYDHQIWHNENITNNDIFTNLDYFAISGLLGYYVALNRERVVAFVKSIPSVVKNLYLLAVIIMLFNLKSIFMHDIWWLDIFKFTIQAIIFTGLVLLYLPGDMRWRISESNIFSRLGKMCYGLYVYHIIWIHVVLRIFRNNEIKLDNWPDYMVFFAITFIGTLITSYLSYRYFEVPILKFKEKLFPR